MSVVRLSYSFWGPVCYVSSWVEPSSLRIFPKRFNVGPASTGWYPFQALVSYSTVGSEGGGRTGKDRRDSPRTFLRGVERPLNAVFQVKEESNVFGTWLCVPACPHSLFFVSFGLVFSPSGPSRSYGARANVRRFPRGYTTRPTVSGR